METYPQTRQLRYENANSDKDDIIRTMESVKLDKLISIESGNAYTICYTKYNENNLRYGRESYYENWEYGHKDCEFTTRKTCMQ